MTNIRIETVQNNDVTTIKVIGDLSNGGSLDSNIDFNSAKKVIIDIGELKPMNSIAIMVWSGWVKEISDKLGEVPIHFQNCHTSFIDAHYLTNIVVPENAIIDSFFVPYFSPDTDEEKEMKLERDVHYSMDKSGAENWIKIEENIQIDGKDYELDVVTQQYFRFLSPFKII